MDVNEERIEVFVKIQKRSGGGVGSGGRVLVKMAGDGGLEVGIGRGGGGWLVAMLGIGGDVGYGGCEQRIEGIVQGTKRYCTII